jgi:hypothetical protein
MLFSAAVSALAGAIANPLITRDNDMAIGRI